MQRHASERDDSAAEAGARRPWPGCGAVARFAGAIAGPALLLAVMAAQAVPICRWVDDSGRTHLSDVVPERYLQVAQCRDSREYAISPDRVIEARERARELKQRADLAGESAAQQPDPAASDAPAPTAAAGPAAATPKRPARGVDATTDCATWRRLYEESGECFGPYRTVGGGVKAEAFEKCRPIPSPDLQCGPARSN